MNDVRNIPPVLSREMGVKVVAGSRGLVPKRDHVEGNLSIDREISVAPDQRWGPLTSVRCEDSWVSSREAVSSVPQSIHVPVTRPSLPCEEWLSGPRHHPERLRKPKLDDPSGVTATSVREGTVVTKGGDLPCERGREVKEPNDPLIF